MKAPMRPVGILALALATTACGIAAAETESADKTELEARAERATDAFAGAADTETVTLDHADYAAVLDAYLTVDEGGVNSFDYDAVTPGDRQRLDAYISAMSRIDPTALTRDQQIAYWSNVYNAVTLAVILDNPPEDPDNAIRKIELRGLGEKAEDSGIATALKQVFTSDGPWDAALFLANGVPLSLNNIEHDILRKMDEPRIHYAVNCASYSCPNLQPKPWTAEGLDADLDAAAAEYINHPRALSQTEDGELVVSSIYEWFQDDFDGSEAGVIAHMRPYAGDAAAVMLEVNEIGSFDYDWTLNSPEGIEAVEADAGS